MDGSLSQLVTIVRIESECHPPAMRTNGRQGPRKPWNIGRWLCPTPQRQLRQRNVAVILSVLSCLVFALTHVSCKTIPSGRIQQPIRRGPRTTGTFALESEFTVPKPRRSMLNGGKCSSATRYSTSIQATILGSTQCLRLKWRAARNADRIRSHPPALKFGMAKVNLSEVIPSSKNRIH